MALPSKGGGGGTVRAPARVWRPPAVFPTCRPWVLPPAAPPPTTGANSAVRAASRSHTLVCVALHMRIHARTHTPCARFEIETVWSRLARASARAVRSRQLGGWFAAATRANQPPNRAPAPSITGKTIRRQVGRSVGWRAPTVVVGLSGGRRRPGTTTTKESDGWQWMGVRWGRPGPAKNPRASRCLSAAAVAAPAAGWPGTAPGGLLLTRAGLSFVRGAEESCAPARANAGVREGAGVPQSARGGGAVRRVARGGAGRRGAALSGEGRRGVAGCGAAGRIGLAASVAQVREQGSRGVAREGGRESAWRSLRGRGAALRVAAAAAARPRAAAARRGVPRAAQRPQRCVRRAVPSTRRWCSS